ncbi:efflux RND transporter periplasmic adaptor subunit [Aquisediminimonas sediminicola]|uniref:efflux RND transporter periplasmic adaptor subunit n=1 Tax=Alteraquisediminimonas sediminicola TaxID=2676787 RepID=UPI001FE68ED1|nr:efflux RND transporter periplasmic adaptor subunit [Aquisediminimonas sediminicola]
MTHALSPRPLLLAGIMLGALALTGCGKDPAKDAKPTPEVGFIVIATGATETTSELPGRVRATVMSEVRPQVSGIVKARTFTEGSLVSAGQTLYQIDPALYGAARGEASARLAGAEAALAAATARADRYATLADSEAVSRQDIDDVRASARQARANVAQARAALQSADVTLRYTRIIAPISGRIGRSSVTPGALVTANQGDALAVIQQLDPVYVDVTQSSVKLLALRRALANGSSLPATGSIRLKLEDGSVYEQTGDISFTEPMVDEATGMVTIRARFPNPDGVLLPGMFVKILAPEAKLAHAVLAPQQGIARNAKGEATALIVGKDNKVEQRVVAATRAIGASWLITDGLKPGDRLIVEGTDKAKPGSLVKPVPTDLQK